MPFSSPRTDIATFDIESTAGDARAGTLRIEDTSLQTPNLLPVVNLYAGGMDRSLYGGGIHRTMKEFMTGHDVIGGGDYSEFFDGIMTSVGSLTDYNISRERYEDYIAEPVKEREVFEDFNGTLFLDSGGFKFLGGYGLDGSNFEVEIDQEQVYEIQQQMGGDIIVNLDRPITRDDDYETRVQKARRTAENVVEFLDLSEGTSSARYLTLHGHNYSMLDTFLQEIDDVVGSKRAHNEFDGVALGSLVPMKDNKGALIDAVQDCRSVLQDWQFDDLPLHVLGISSSAIPLLAAVGADSFDSSSYLHSAINGKYNTSLIETKPLDDVDFNNCDCPVCSNEDLVRQMKGDTEYRKDELGPVAMHNLILQKREVAHIRECIHEPGSERFVEYIEESIGQNKGLRRFAHRVVNESLGGYF
ncbi:tRNA-guanine transglycosylase [Haloferax prahovense]|uniref:tRNA-guanine transglycosylase n=1 Tax=Haloferax prahovense TaxID=381852 RepID=UPI001FD2E23A|nr:tRNA-guanine transglycosylase [Haloferax prahovense]